MLCTVIYAVLHSVTSNAIKTGIMLLCRRVKEIIMGRLFLRIVSKLPVCCMKFVEMLVMNPYNNEFMHSLLQNVVLGLRTHSVQHSEA